MRQKIQALLAHLNHGLVDREHALKVILLTVLAGENIVLVGPPGTGKSLLARRIAQELGGGAGERGLSYFEYLLTKFSTPEELFGPLSISALKNDRFHRNTEGYLPSVELSFLDEVFKASSSILNALLTLMNERIFHNGTDLEKAPLRALIAASNELPTHQEELSALYDRFLVRCFVDYVSEDRLSELLEAPPLDSALPLAEHITWQDMERLKEAAKAVTLPPTVAQALQQIWRTHREAFKEDRRESLSDRRLMKCLNLLRVSAASNGRAEVDLSDLLLLKNCLWNHSDNAVKVQDLVLGALRRHSYPVQLDQSLLADGRPIPDMAIYEVDGDSTMLIPASVSASRPFSVSIHSVKSIGQMNSVVKGFCGSGTLQDPLLVQSSADLMALARPEIGMQGYHFRQTDDIDCRNLKTWIPIEFQGVFNGGGKNIFFNQKEYVSKYLLSVVGEKSVIEHVNMHGCGFVEKIIKSEIRHCSLRLEEKQNNIDLFGRGILGFVGELNECQMYSCESDYFLVQENAFQSEIKFCKSHGCMVRGEAHGCTFISCAANYSFFGGEPKKCTILDCSARYSNHDGGLYKYVIRECLVERVFISFGESRYKLFGVNPCGIVNGIDGGSLKNSAIGEISGDCLENRICGVSYNEGELANNYSTDVNEINKGVDDKDGVNGQSIPKELFDQRFFENILDWNFDSIWHWDVANNQPALRYAGAYPDEVNENPALPHSAQNAVTVDFLIRQVKSNIWI